MFGATFTVNREKGPKMKWRRKVRAVVAGKLAGHDCLSVAG
jgi:hypothetical protein